MRETFGEIGSRRHTTSFRSRRREQFFMRVKAETDRTTLHSSLFTTGLQATAMASIALPLPFRRLLLKIRTTPPCGQRLPILPHVNQRVKTVHQGDDV